MKKILLLFTILLSINSFSQETTFKEYSYTEFFKLIEEETDTIFKLKDALIIYNSKTDERFRVKSNPNKIKDTAYVHRNDIVVDKHLELYNVQFSFDYNDTNNYEEGVLLDIHFKKSVQLSNIKSFYIQYCRFDELFRYSLTECDKTLDSNTDTGNLIFIDFSSFDEFGFFNNCDNLNTTSYYFRGNTFKPAKKARGLALNVSDTSFFVFEENTISNFGFIFYSISDNSGRFRIRDNVFDSDFIHISKTNFNGQLMWTNNRFTSTLFLELNPFSSGNEIDWNQFENGIASYNSYVNYTLKKLNRYPVQLSIENNKKLSKQYLDSIRVYNADAFSEEMSIKSHFYSFYKSRYNTQIANEVYLQLKDFETDRLKIIHNQNPSFRSYFKWKVNQFLKLFSDYGTEPSKAIVFSMYVIFIFALIYLLFPNSWDAHGRKRIMNRYAFFFTYMNKKSGIHEVYLDNQKEDLLEFDEFKTLVEKQGKTVPKFFTATALPLYKWAISGTKFSSTILKRFDIMKGTWSELPKSKRIWKSVLLIGAFLIAICYDILIKMLNALMLSINTFTTLGFGEIPIKGLPRYLAIIQGFIGWFMLTIFSVSLISQLLN